MLPLTLRTMEQAGETQNHAIIFLDSSPFYDFVQSMSLLVDKPGAARAHPWIAQTARQLSSEAPVLWRNIQRWFAGPCSPASALLALVPFLPADISAFLAGLDRLPLVDFLRLIVVNGPTNPDTPLDAETLLNLHADQEQARAFCNTHLRFTGKSRALLLQILHEPGKARAELRALLHEYYEQTFKQIEPQVIAEQQALLVQLRQAIATDATLFLEKRKEFLQQSLSPIIFTPSVFMQNHNNAYLHEIHRSLFDFCAYEPFILLVCQQRILPAGKQREAGRAPLLPAAVADEPEQLARLFAVLADPSRLRLLHLLAQQPYYQQELAVALGVSGATVSHHLAMLLHSGLVRMERRAHRTYIVLCTDELAQQLIQSQQYLLADNTPAEGTDSVC